MYLVKQILPKAVDRVKVIFDARKPITKRRLELNIPEGIISAQVTAFRNSKS